MNKESGYCAVDTVRSVSSPTARLSCGLWIVTRATRPSCVDRSTRAASAPTDHAVTSFTTPTNCWPARRPLSANRSYITVWSVFIRKAVLK